MKERGHFLLITVKDIPAAKQLLGTYGMEYIDIGGKPATIMGKLVNQLKFDWRLSKIVRKNKINTGVGSSITLAHVSKISHMKSFVFDDDDASIQPLFAKFAHPFADYLISPDALAHERKKKNHIVYPSYHELAYLHPNRFKPDLTVLKEAGLKPGDTFFVMRFNVFKAHHDVGVTGLTKEQKLELVHILEKKGKVFITTEAGIEAELSPYRLPVSPEKIHSLLYYAAMFVGDSQTMTSEASVLGTPAVKCNTLAGKLSVPNEIEKKYGLCFAFLPAQYPEMVDKVRELLTVPRLKEQWRQKREKMLEDKIDVTAFMVNLIEGGGAPSQ